MLACGTDVAYPSAHHQLFAAVRSQGVLVSECPMGAHPTRLRFLVRNRVIAALSRGTVVIEAAVRSGALNTAGHAIALNRHLAAVPGPVTSENSAGCHRLIRQGTATCVTAPEEMIELVGAMGADLAPEPRGPVLPRDQLDPETRKGPRGHARPERSGPGDDSGGRGRRPGDGALLPRGPGRRGIRGARLPRLASTPRVSLTSSRGGFAFA